MGRIDAGIIPSMPGSATVRPAHPTQNISQTDAQSFRQTLVDAHGANASREDIEGGLNVLRSLKDKIGAKAQQLHEAQQNGHHELAQALQSDISGLEKDADGLVQDLYTAITLKQGENGESLKAAFEKNDIAQENALAHDSRELNRDFIELSLQRAR